MLQYFVKRLVAMIPKVLLITAAIFFAMEILPGDVITRSIPVEELAEMSEAEIEKLREAKGLNDPAVIRYFRWLGDIAQGHFGYSYGSGADIGHVLATRLPATIELAIFGLILSTVFGIGFGFLAAVKQNSPLDYSSTFLGMVGVSVPEFFFGMLFILLFAINLQWLPTGGRISQDDLTFWGHLKHMIMPSVCLGIGLTATLMRYTRNSMLDVMNKDYIKTARAKGASEFLVYVKHCFRNGCAPVMQLLVGRLGMLISGTTVIESVFNYPGMGGLLLSAIAIKDVPVVMTILLLISLTTLVTAFIGDFLLACLDPRVRFGKE